MKQSRRMSQRTPAPAALAAPRRADPDRANPVLRRDAAELQRALNDLIRVYQFRDRRSICCHGISVTQCYALDALAQRDGTTLSELAAELYLDASTASRVVDSLERKGLARRRHDPGDGRAVRVEITAEGRALEERIGAELLAESEWLLAEFDPEIRQATARLIARLAREAERRFGGPDGACCTP